MPLPNDPSYVVLWVAIVALVGWLGFIYLRELYRVAFVEPRERASRTDRAAGSSCGRFAT